MAYFARKNITTNGLVFEIDAANKLSEGDTRLSTVSNVNLDGIDDYLSSSSADFNFTGESITIFGWFFHDLDQAGNKWLVTKGLTTDRVIEIGRVNASSKLFVILDGAQSNTTAEFNGNDWNFFGVSWDSSDNSLIIQLNEVTQVFSPIVFNGGTAGDFQIGKFHESANYLNHKQSTLAIYKDRAFTATELRALHDRGRGISYLDADKNNLVSWYDFNELSGTRFDSHGTNHLTDNGGIVHNNDINVPHQVSKDLTNNIPVFKTNGVVAVNGEYVFDNSAKYLGFGAGTFRPAIQDFTCSVWVKINSLATDSFPIIVPQGNTIGVGSGEWWIVILTTGQVSIGMRGLGGGGGSSPLGTIQTDQWYHIVNTVQHAPQESRIYVNGTQVASDNSWTTLIDNPTAPMSIGGDNGFGSYNGNISNVQIYNRVLSPDEILNNYNAQKLRFI